MMLFNSLAQEDVTPFHHHAAWLDFLRDRIWSKIQFEKDMIPSITALKKHWKRSCWIQSVWNQATHNMMLYPPLEGNGWKFTDNNEFVIDWDSEENVTQVWTRVMLIKKGCGCKTGCTSGRCKCRKAGTHCGPGCKCTGCCNLPSPDTAVSHMDVEGENNDDQPT